MCVRERGEREEIGRAPEKEYVWGVVPVLKRRERERERDKEREKEREGEKERAREITHTHTHAHMHAHTHVHTHAHTYTHAQTHMLVLCVRIKKKTETKAFITYNTLWITKLNLVPATKPRPSCLAIPKSF